MTLDREPCPADVRVCWIDLRKAARLLPCLLPELAANERQRARRLRTPARYTEFVVTRGLLRRLLRDDLPRPPETLRIETGPHGKPFLREDRSLHFSVSHAPARAVLALSRRGPIGVDVERLDGGVDVDGLAGRCFSAPEQTALRQLPPNRRLIGFFTCWTRKEALVKALGCGLSTDLRRLQVGVGAGAPVAFPAPEGRSWDVIDLEAGHGHVAALVAPWAPGGRSIRRVPWETLVGAA